MAGKEANISPMWKELRKTFELDQEVQAVSNTYLSCNQYNVDIDKEQTNLFIRPLNPSSGTTCNEDKEAFKAPFKESHELKKHSTSGTIVRQKPSKGKTKHNKTKLEQSPTYKNPLEAVISYLF